MHPWRGVCSSHMWVQVLTVLHMGDVIHSSGIPSWNLLWDISLQTCLCLAGWQPQAEQCLLATQSGADHPSGNKVLALVLVRVTAAKGR